MGPLSLHSDGPLKSEKMGGDGDLEAAYSREGILKRWQQDDKLTKETIANLQDMRDKLIKQLIRIQQPLQELHFKLYMIGVFQHSFSNLLSLIMLNKF